MTSYFTFAPSQTAPFTFQPTLDGVAYNATVLWNIAGQRYYLLLADSDGNTILNKPLVGSPVAQPIASLSWSNGWVTMVMAARHGFNVNSVVALTISGAAPAAFNGVVKALVASETMLTWPLVADPGPVTNAGFAGANISLVAGYFTSTLVYREANEQFEVNP